MSLTSYRAAPPRVNRERVDRFCVTAVGAWGGWVLECPVGRPGSDLLSRVLRRSTIGAEGFHGRVRDGIGCGPLAMTTKSASLAEVSRRDAETAARTGAARGFLRKEVIQPQVPLRLPCYDFTPVADLTVVGCLLLRS